MNDLEKLLKADRDAAIPDPPDPAYTIAAVRRRLGPPAAPARRSGDWPLAVAAIGICIGAVLLALVLGMNAWWLAGVPLIVLLVCPILLRKGA